MFVVKLLTDTGRIRPDDKTMMKLVLDAAPIQPSYSIINKLSVQIMTALEKNPALPKKLNDMLNDGLPGTNHMYLYRFDEELSAKENVVPKLNKQFHDFLKRAPTLHIQSSSVTNIATSEFQKELGELKRIIEMFQQMDVGIRKEMADQEKLVEKQQKERVREAEKLRDQ